MLQKGGILAKGFLDSELTVGVDSGTIQMYCEGLGWLLPIAGKYMCSIKCYAHACAETAE